VSGVERPVFSSDSAFPANQPQQSSAHQMAVDQAGLLQEQVQRLERQRLVKAEEVFSSRFSRLDQQLPVGGLVCGELVEWLGDEGSGAGTLGLWTAWQATRSGGVVVVLDRRHEFYPPAVADWGVDLKKLVVIHPRDVAEELWALDQALRCRAVAAVWCCVERITQQDFRRLQLAAEQGRTSGMLIRSRRWLKRPSWAHLQLCVTPVIGSASDHQEAKQKANPKLKTEGRTWQVHVTRCRTRTQKQPVSISWDERSED